jgi:NAD(P)-dependent dehydrogenase (short-subunit alcohol dehydrogenase family)
MTKTWLITGCSRGLGWHLAQAVLARGDRVVATARKAEAIGEFGVSNGGQLTRVALDVTDPDSVSRAVTRAIDEFGVIDVVVNNAGYANSAPIETGSDRDFRQQLETNLFGVINVTRAVIPVMRANDGGQIIQISSIVGRIGARPGMAAYSCAKWAVEAFSEVLNAEVAEFGIRTIVVEPGGLRTDWAGASMIAAPCPPEYANTVGRANDARKNEIDGRQAGDPARAAELIVELADMTDPPFRVVLGRRAIASAQRAATNWLKELAEWSEFGGRADFPDVGNQ